ncbi:nucleotide synthetase [Novosphingobium sp. BL-8H]|uniref:nucleotide synthetase n=1 Tax=Novosphingobium sp. BL-8H TaxID=3127640 RepID=UPI0037582A52
MSTVNYTEYGLAPWIDFEGVGSTWQAKDEIAFTVKFKGHHCGIVLEYEQKSGKDYIAIENDTNVCITLDGDQIWFSKEFEGITTKESLSSFYGSLEYLDYDEKVERYKTVRFKARYNKGGKYDTCHRFNINIDLRQKADDGTERWIGLTIDPDIKNPPPHA